MKTTTILPMDFYADTFEKQIKRLELPELNVINIHNYRDEVVSRIYNPIKPFGDKINILTNEIARKRPKPIQRDTTHIYMDGLKKEGIFDYYLIYEFKTQRTLLKNQKYNFGHVATLLMSTKIKIVMYNNTHIQQWMIDMLYRKYNFGYKINKIIIRKADDNFTKELIERSGKAYLDYLVTK